MNLIKKASVLLVAFWVAFSSSAQDSLRVEKTDTLHFTPQQLILPGTLITAGALCVGIPPLVQARKWVTNTVGIHSVVPVDDYLQYAPLAGYVFLDFAGVKSKRPFVDRVIVGATAAILTFGVAQGVKHLVKESRPNNSANTHSFPSGHTSYAFMGAELLRQDYGPWVGACGYLAASAVGVMRVVRGYHWFNDVLAGAGVGILCARAAEWLLSFNRRWLGLDKKKGEAAVIMPTYSPFDNSVSLSVAMVF